MQDSYESCIFIVCKQKTNRIYGPTNLSLTDKQKTGSGHTNRSNLETVIKEETS